MRPSDNSPTARHTLEGRAEQAETVRQLVNASTVRFTRPTSRPMRHPVTGAWVELR